MSRTPAFCRTSSAVITLAPFFSLAAIPEQYTPARNPDRRTSSTQANK
jgi:hypothetical protein